MPRSSTFRKRMTADQACLRLNDRVKAGQNITLMGRVLVAVRPQGTGARQNDTQADLLSFAQQIMENVDKNVNRQLVFAMGQSGAGKTTNITNVLEALLQAGTKDIPGTVGHLKSSTDLLGLFTNASTASNPNSTRCVTGLRLTFDPADLSLQEAHCSIQGLETHRAVPDSEEDYFNVFHLLQDYIFAPISKLQDELNNISKRMENRPQGPCSMPEDATKRTEWFWTCLVTLYGDKAFLFAKRLLAIHGLSGICFDLLETHRGQLLEAVTRVAELLDCPPESLLQSMAYIHVDGKDIFQGPDKSTMNKVGLGAAIYHSLVQDLVHACNASIAVHLGPERAGESGCSVTLWDIPGAESFEKNHLAQYTVNLLNEHVQHEATCLLTSVQGAPSSGSVPESVRCARAVGQALGDMAKRKTLDVQILLDKLAADRTIEVDEARCEASWLHYSGKKTYDLSHFLSANSIKPSDRALPIIQAATAFANGAAAPTPRFTSAVSHVEAAAKELRALIKDAEQVYMLCCIKNLRDRREMKQTALHVFIDAMFPRFSHILSRDKVLDILSASSNENGQAEWSEGKLKEYALSQGLDHDFHVVGHEVYLSSELYARLSGGPNESLVEQDTDESDAGVGDDTFDLGYSNGRFELEVGSEAQVGKLKRTKTMLEMQSMVAADEAVKKRSEYTKFVAQMKSDYEKVLAQAQARLVYERSEAEATTARLLSEQETKISDMRFEHAEILEKSHADLTRSIEDHDEKFKHHVAETKAKHGAMESQMDAVALKLERSEDSLIRLNEQLASVEKRSTHLARELDNVSKRLASKDQLYQAETAGTKDLTDKLYRAQSEKGRLHDDAVRLCRHYLSRFHMYDNNAAPLDLLVPMQAEYLQTKILSLVESSKDWKCLKKGVLSCALNDRPAITFFPLLRVIEHITSNPDSDAPLDYVNELEMIAVASIKLFKVEFTKSLQSSSLNSAKHITHETVMNNISPLFRGVQGLLCARELLEFPVTRWLEGILHDSPNSVEYPNLDRGVLIGLLSEFAELHHPEHTEWLTSLVDL